MSNVLQNRPHCLNSTSFHLKKGELKNCFCLGTGQIIDQEKKKKSNSLVLPRAFRAPECLASLKIRMIRNILTIRINLIVRTMWNLDPYEKYHWVKGWSLTWRTVLSCAPGIRSISLCDEQKITWNADVDDVLLSLSVPNFHFLRYLLIYWWCFTFTFYVTSWSVDDV